MVALPGYYTDLVHDRFVDKDMMRRMKVKAVVLMQPNPSSISKVWSTIKNNGVDKPIIILRMWDWDDGRTRENPNGVYKNLELDPVRQGQELVGNWASFLKNAREDARRQNLDYPPDNSTFLCHLVNEPDTNYYMIQINLMTSAAIMAAEGTEVNLLVYNFGTGHPAHLSGGVPDWSQLSSLKLVENSGGRHVVGVHEYFNSNGMAEPAVYPWHIGRHNLGHPLDRVRYAITEWGCEELVNNKMDDHHGYVGKIDPKVYANNYEYYCTEIAKGAEWVNIFAGDMVDRVWNTFDPTKALVEFEGACRNIWKAHDGGIVKPPDPPTPPERPGIGSPVAERNAVMTQRFGENYEDYMGKYGTPGHNGIDIIGDVEKEPILAFSDGTVEWTGYDSSYGYYVRLWHEGLGLHSFYAHLDSIEVNGGESVSIGHKLGTMGMTGDTTGVHLHFELRMGTRYSYYDITYGHGKGRINPETIFAQHGIFW